MRLGHLRVVAATFALLAAASTGAAPTASDLEARIGEQKQELQRLREELHAGRQRVKELESQARDQAQEIRLVEDNLSMQQRILEQIDSTERLHRSLVEESSRDVEKAVTSWQERRAILSRRVVALYKHGRPKPGQAWIQTGDPGAWLRTLKGLRIVVRADESLLESVRSREATARKTLAAHRKRVAGLEELARMRQAEVEALEASKEERTTRLASLEDARKAEQARLDQLEASQAMLEKLLVELEKRRREEEERRIAAEKARVAEEARLRREEEKRRKELEVRRKREEERHRREVERSKREKRPPPPPPVIAEDAPPPRERLRMPEAVEPEGPPPARKGLCWPVRGPILSSFGLHKNPVLGTVTRNLGVEIQGKAGQTVVASASGTVAAVTQLPGRGNTVILQHPGGYFSIYGQLERIQVRTGDKVQACNAIASLEGGAPPRVYFEYRHNLKAEDPLEWLTR